MKLRQVFYWQASLPPFLTKLCNTSLSQSFDPLKKTNVMSFTKFPCASCPWSYIGETKRSFSTRKKEHIRNTKQCAINSNVAKHAWAFDHTIDFTGAKIIDTANNRTRKTLESWHTAKTAEADNNSCPLPKQYSILLKKH